MTFSKLFTFHKRLAIFNIMRNENILWSFGSKQKKKANLSKNKRFDNKFRWEKIFIYSDDEEN